MKAVHYSSLMTKLDVTDVHFIIDCNCHIHGTEFELDTTFELDVLLVDD